MGNCISDQNNSNQNDQDNIDNLLMRLEPNNLKKTSYEGTIARARVISVYDGDTITIAFFPEYHIKEIPFVGSFRLYGFDAPEMKPSLSDEFHDLHKECGKKVQNIISNKILDKLVWVEFMKNEKFGRMMGNIYLEPKDKNGKFGQSLNDWIVEHKLGKEYHGEKKGEWTKQDFEHILHHDF